MAENKEPMSFKKVITIIVIVILALLMVGGASYIIAMVSQSKAEAQSTWGSYNGEAILLEPNTVFYNTLASSEDLSNAYLSGDYNTMISEYQNAYQQQVLFVALNQEAKEAGIIAPQDMVDDLILETGVYNGADGTFSEEVYNSATEAQKLSINNYYKTLLPYTIVVSDLQNTVISEAERAFVESLAAKTRSFEYFVINYNVYPDEKAVAFANENDGLFDTVDLSVLTCSTEDNAKIAYDALERGTAWAEVVSFYSEDGYKDSEGKVGDLPVFGLLSNLADENDLEQITSLESGSYSSPLASPNGVYIIYKLDSAIEKADLSDAETLSLIKYYISSNNLDDMSVYLEGSVLKASDLAKTDFEKAAESVNATIFTVSDVNNNIGNSSYIGGLAYYDENGYLASVSQSEAVSRELFTIALDSVTDAIKVDEVDNVYVVARVTDINDENEAMASITAMFYSYYASSQPVNDKFYAVFTSDKYEDNFYAQMLTQLFGSV